MFSLSEKRNSHVQEAERIIIIIIIILVQPYFAFRLLDTPREGDPFRPLVLDTERRED